jgi:superfamily II DNA or RNA helicase
MQLRKYQIKTIKKTADSLRNKKQAPLIVLPTGAGKTVIFSEIAKRAVLKNNNVLILVHRRELIKQASKKLADIQVPHGIIAAGFKPSDVPIQVASVQTIVRRLSSTSFKPALIIIDEAHHSVAGSWKKILDHWPNAKRIGVTATPCRLSGEGLRVMFDDLILGPTVKNLVHAGFLSPHKVFGAPQKINFNKIKMRGGDYAKDELAQEIIKADITGDAVKQYKKHANGLPAIAFCVNVAHAEIVKAKFNNSGINADIITGDMDTDDRDQVINGLSTGKIQVLVSIEVISEGFDLPAVSTAILLRKTASLGLYLQQVGRVLRPQKNKTAIVLDHVGNTITHGFIDDPKNWSLDAPKKSKKNLEKAPAVQTCKQCFATFKPQPTCPECGFTTPIKKREITQKEGELIELKREQVRIRQAEKSQAKLLIRKARSLEELKTVAKILGYKEGWAYQMNSVRRYRKNKNISADQLGWI